MLLKCWKLFKCLTVIKWLKKEEETNRKTQGEKIRFSSFYFSLNFFTFSFFFLFLFISHKLKREFYESLETDAEGPVGWGCGEAFAGGVCGTHVLTLLTRAGRRQFIPGRFQSPGVEINTQDHRKNGGRKCPLKEMTVHVIKLYIPEERCSDKYRCQDKSVESLKKGGEGKKWMLTQGSHWIYTIIK